MNREMREALYELEKATTDERAIMMVTNMVRDRLPAPSAVTWLQMQSALAVLDRLASEHRAESNRRAATVARLAAQPNAARCTATERLAAVTAVQQSRLNAQIQAIAADVDALVKDVQRHE